jgi:WD40 repeat protein/tRNA A-37 threonylcarbamoyl transferase component Bud32
LDFGDYELLEEIGRGGMGVVYKARQRSLNRIVALKLILSGRFASKESVERLRAEAAAAATMRHPNIVAIHEMGQVASQHYFSMDYVAGRSLAEMVRERPLPANRAAAYVRTIAEAMEEAHRNGTLHRDLKPSNVLIDEHDQPRITDFGLAKRLGDDSELTVSGKAIGSPGYMPPEQVLGKRNAISRRSDVYAMGALLYHLLTGRPPFSAETMEATLAQALNNEPAAPRSLNPTVPCDLETICLKCLEKEPVRRYRTAQELADDLRRFEYDEPISARPVTTSEKLWRWARRNPSIATLAASLLIVFLAGLVGVTWQWRRAERHVRTEATQRQRLEDTLAHKEIQEAERLFAVGDVSSALARLARILRQNPMDRVAATRLLSALTYRNFALPTLTPLVHEASVLSAEFSRDGQRVVTGAADGSVRVWNAQTGKLLLELPSHAARVRHAVFSPDGQRIVSASEDGTARIRDAHTGQELTPVLRHNDKIRRVRFSPDGNLVVSASADATARLWNSRTGELAAPPLQHGKYVNEAVFSRDGKWVATSSEDGTACVWDAQTGRRLGDPMQHGGDVVALRFSPDGKRIVTTSTDGTARIWRALSGQTLTPPLPHKAHVAFANFSPDGAKVVTASHDDTARLWNATTGEPLTPPLVFDSNVLHAEFSPDGRRVFAISDTGARLWDAQTGLPLTELIVHEALLETMGGFSPEGGRVVTTSLDKTAIVWDVRPGAARPRHLRGAHADYGLAFSADGRRVVAGTERTFDVFVWDVGSGEMSAGPLRHPDKVHWFEFSPGGEHLLTACRDGGVRIWDLRSGQLVTPQLQHRESLHTAHFSRDGRRIVTASDDDTARIWDANTGQELTKPLQHRNDVAWAEFSPDGRRVATASADFTACVWDATSGEPITPPLHHESIAASAHFSPDGRWLLTASQDATARIWDAATGQSAGQRLTHRGRVLSAEFSLDGRRIITASADRTARLWDARTGSPLAEPLEHKAPLPVAHFNSDGTRIVTISEEPISRIWDTATGHLLFEPLLHHGTVGDAPDARFAPNGDRLATVTPDGVLRLWDLPTPPLPVPDWLSDLTEAVAAKRFDAQGRSIPVSARRLVQLKQHLSASPGADFYARWAKWFFADRDARDISPFSQITAQKDANQGSSP